MHAVVTQRTRPPRLSGVGQRGRSRRQDGLPTDTIRCVLKHNGQDWAVKRSIAALHGSSSRSPPRPGKP
eukprot:CAMPEP_0168695272 /NCGR_PEP_ID=MMETSP0503-20121227/34736_1 /TAXON_ID=89963 /ORGANISM="Heterocapsa rotundata, Strain SCCAP K-0483" /LENGTH=68 /DNA_ID=CAMNT_0008740967 /DNA_START=52 /DNA_END=255 /DNA_ORIENTATION=-